MQGGEKSCDSCENLCKKRKSIVQYKTENLQHEEGVNNGEIKRSQNKARRL